MIHFKNSVNGYSVPLSQKSMGHNSSAMGLFVLVISVLSSNITVIIGDACKRWFKSSSATLDKLSRK